MVAASASFHGKSGRLVMISTTSPRPSSVMVAAVRASTKVSCSPVRANA
ncbi:unannotated protein [freshwater metagenome]|uniref:Unannotated protein n=1 Tax=freshwater metagenome TaxID=449393 RepID=A0A6J7QNQ0_9ZZZZ